MRRTLSGAAVGVVVIMFGVAPLVAHHAFSAEFDRNKPVKLQGAITGMDWVNPHAWIHLDVKKPDGKVEKWMVEGGTPNSLLRRGLKRTDLKVGIEVTMSGFQAKDGQNRASGARISLPDGRSIFVGSSGTGAPDDPDQAK